MTENRQKKPSRWNRSDKFAALAFGISALAFAHTLYSGHRADIQWKAINIGRLEISRDDQILFGQWPEAEFRKIEFGFPQRSYKTAMNNVLGNEVGAAYALGFKNRTSHSTLPGFSLTKAAAHQDFAARRLDPAEFEIVKMSMFYFEFKNIGRTDIADVKVAIEGRGFPTDQWSKIAQTTATVLSPEAAAKAYVTLTMGIDSDPFATYFKAKATYKDIYGDSHEERWNMTHNVEIGEFDTKRIGE